MQDTPLLARKPRKEDDPKVIGLWKIGRTIGKGSSGKLLFFAASPSSLAPLSRISLRDRSCADRPPLKDGAICSDKDSV
jgi:hypothetical protein